MKQHIATTKEQSLRLAACGVAESTADMVWTSWDNDGEHIEQLSVMDVFAYEFPMLNPLPAWSLSALLALMPPIITTLHNSEYFWFARIHDPDDDDNMIWEARWMCNGFINTFAYNKENGRYERFFDESPIEACVRAIEWLAANGYRLNGIEK